MEKLRVFTTFSGYDSQCLALDRVKERHPEFDYELVGWSEIDKYAIVAHNALFPQWADRNYGDITQIDWAKVPDFDFFTYSSPCQDFSNAGKQAGGKEGSGTRSSLLWECRKAIIAKRPTYLMLENVKALTSQKFLPLLRKWMDELTSYGYDNFCQVLNAKDYGIPQNRERVYLVSVKRERESRFRFPNAVPLERVLKDVLEKDVDERYYLSDDRIQGLALSNMREELEGNGYRFAPKNPNELTGGGGKTANSVTTHSGSRKTDTFLKVE